MKSIFLKLWMEETSQDSPEMAIVVALLGLGALLVGRFASSSRHLAFAVAIFRPDVPTPPQVLKRQFSEIVGVHPAVLRMIAGLPPEHLGGLRGVSDALIDQIYGFPRVAVVPVRGGSQYWCWLGVRAYLRLLDRGWHGKVAVLDYGRISEQKIVDLAHFDWVYASAITGPAQTTDWATAQRWQENTDYVCRPAKSGNVRPTGLKTYAKLRGLDPRRLRADIAPKEPRSTERPGTTPDDDEEGSKD